MCYHLYGVMRRIERIVFEDPGWTPLLRPAGQQKMKVEYLLVAKELETEYSYKQVPYLKKDVPNTSVFQPCHIIEALKAVSGEDVAVTNRCQMIASEASCTP